MRSITFAPTRRAASAAVLVLALLALSSQALAWRADGTLRLGGALTCIGGVLLAGTGAFPPSSARLGRALRIVASVLIFAGLCATITNVFL